MKKALLNSHTMQFQYPISYELAEKNCWEHSIPIIDIDCCQIKYEKGCGTKEKKGDNVHIAIAKPHSIQIPSKYTWKTSS
jgi:hypothetical protein